ncbi:MAG TPA: DNA ligase D [Capsulimonadaceae bacterium]|jgi:bifunctional non-homologous end joining protein LigD
MALDTYNKKRDFARTPEPTGNGTASPDGARRFVIQEHHATRLHFDLRLEMGGVLKSWAVPKGPSKDTKVRRLAMMTEDHPLQYVDFQGHIPEGEYGAGDMAVWDHGTYDVTDGGDPEAEIAAGKLSVVLHGEKLTGKWELIHTGGKGRDENQWLLIKGVDEFVDPEWALVQELEGESNRDRQALLQAKAGKPVRRTKAGTNGAGTVTGAAMPTEIHPMLAVLVDKPFSDPDWIYEIKWDGYRAVCFIENGKSRLVSRNQLDFTPKYPSLATLPTFVHANNAIIDGEIVALDEHGQPHFQLLQNISHIRSTKSVADHGDIVYEAFDLLWLNGRDLRNEPLTERKRLLREIVFGGGPIRYCDHVESDGDGFFKAVSAQGLEGMIAKRADSKYVARRDPSWLKVKTVMEQEVVIGGFTEPRRTRSHFGALTVGLYDGGKLEFCGHVGSGFDAALLGEIHKKLDAINTDECPFATEPKTNEPVTWVRPEVVCEVKFSNWTADGSMRHPIFLGLREDKSPKDCVREKPEKASTEVKAVEGEAVSETGTKREKSPAKTPAKGAKPGLDQLFAKGGPEEGILKIGSASVPLTHLNKVYWPEDGYTKRDLIAYMYAVAKTMLPYMKNRPFTVQRYPTGYKGISFYQHDLPHPPSYFGTHELTEDDGKVVHYGVAKSEAALVYLANSGAIPIHLWHSSVDHPDKPDWVLFDLDPDDSDWATACKVAVETRNLLKRVGLRAYPKTSGSQGLHIYVPIKAELPFADVLQRFANPLSRIIAAAMPESVTVERLKRNRKHGQVYFDCYQNSPGKTAVAPYSVRAHRGATVSMPLTWDEVERGVDMNEFTIATAPDRISEVGDLFKRVLTDKQSLPDAIEKLGKLADKAVPAKRERKTR